MNEKILIIEDDKVILKFLTLALKTHGYTVIGSENGLTGLNLFMNQNPDLVLLDLGLPDLDGMLVLKEIRNQKSTPIIIISARGREQDKVNALDQGANDYVTKPFNLGEVLARIRVSLRNQKEVKESSIFEFENLIVDFDKYLVKLDHEEIHLTPIEFKLLELLIKNQGKVLTHAFLQDHVWGYQTVDEYQSLRVFMASIRRKIEGNQGNRFIITEIGVGYRFRDM